MKRLYKYLILVLLLSQHVQANGRHPYYIPEERENFSNHQKAMNFGILYGAQWAYYLIGQRYIIKEYGSAENWYQNPFRPHFDKDSFDYNIFKHSLTGNFYYQWYRSRGYVEKSAFAWTFISSLAFEFTIETITERPSYQDIYQTPVFGTVLGIGLEKVSRYCHSWDTWYGHTFGYILNPFTLIPQQKDESEMAAYPIIEKDKFGGSITYRF